MVTYYQAGTQVAIRKSKRFPSTGTGRFCGESVAVEEGTEVHRHPRQIVGGM